MLGGKMIAKGTYGCVYKPEIKCEGSDVRGDGVTKIMKHEDAAIELKEQKRVDEIDPDFKYHLQAPNICDVGEYDLENDNNLSECSLVNELIKKGRSWKEDFVLVQMKDGGVSIYDYMHKTHPARTKSLTDAKKFILGMKNLFEGLVDFDENEFVHFDIKSQNIVVKEENMRFNYIDFGLSTTRDNILEEFGFMLTAGYYALPFDIIFTKHSNYRLLKDATEDHLKDIAFTSYLKQLMNKTYTKGYMPIFDEKYIANSESLFKQTYDNDDILKLIHNEMNTNSKSIVIDEIYRKLDVFSLGVVLVELFKFFTGKKYNINNPASDLDKFFKDLHALIQKMTHPFYKERYSAEEAYTHFMELIHKYDISKTDILTGVELPKIDSIKSLVASKEDIISKLTHETKLKTKGPKKRRIKITKKKLILVDDDTTPISKKRSIKGTRKRHNKGITVRNPRTGRWIKKDGRLAKKLGLA